MKKILIMDSDEALLNILSQEMIAAGYEPIAVTSAQEGLAYSAEASLIIIAVELADQNGFVTCGTLKRNPQTAHIPVFMTSSADSTAEFERHLNLPVHADGYYLKPLDIPAMLEAIQYIFAESDAYATESYDPNALQADVYYDENGYAAPEGEYVQDGYAAPEGEYVQDGYAAPDSAFIQDGYAAHDAESFVEAQPIDTYEPVPTTEEHAIVSQESDDEYPAEDVFSHADPELPIQEDILEASLTDAAPASEADDMFTLSPAPNEIEIPEHGEMIKSLALDDMSLFADIDADQLEDPADPLFLDDEPFSLTPEEPAEKPSAPTPKPESAPSIPPMPTASKRIAPLSAHTAPAKSISPINAHAVPPLAKKLPPSPLPPPSVGLSKATLPPPPKPAGIAPKSDLPGLPSIGAAPISAISKPAPKVDKIAALAKDPKAPQVEHPTQSDQLSILKQQINELSEKLHKAETEAEELRARNAELLAHIEELNQNNDQLAMLSSENEIQKDKLKALAQQLMELAQ